VTAQLAEAVDSTLRRDRGFLEFFARLPYDLTGVPVPFVDMFLGLSRLLVEDILREDSREASGEGSTEDG